MCGSRGAAFDRHYNFLTVRVTCVVSVVVPAVPVMVIVLVPAAALVPRVISIVELPEPPVIVVGLKLTVTPDGTPDADKTTEEVKPAEGVTVIVEATEPGASAVIELGVALRLNTVEGAVVTIKVTLVVAAVPLVGVPVTVMG